MPASHPSLATTALVADDEEAPRAQLLDALQHCWPELHVVAEAGNGTDAWDAYLEHEPRLCILDVRMPGLTGIEVARRIGAHAHVMFIAAQGDHALAAFDSGGINHVVKPIDEPRLALALMRVRQHLHEPPPDLHGLLDALSGQVRRPAPLDVLQAQVGSDTKLIRVEDVLFFEGDARNTRVVHRDGEDLVRVPLKELVGQLDPELFWQIHRSIIVNQHEITGVERADASHLALTLRGRAARLPVAPQFQDLFQSR